MNNSEKLIQLSLTVQSVYIVNHRVVVVQLIEQRYIVSNYVTVDSF